jgi:sporulation protein YlmC with PRC-barrel domain
VELGRQILDQQLVDRNNRNIGKVDGIVLQLRDDAPPRIAAILTGGHLLSHRLHPWIERVVKRLTDNWCPREGEPIRIEWSLVRKIGVDVKVDVAGDAVMPWEHWVRDHIVRRIPGAG